MTHMIIFTIPDRNLQAIGFVTVAFFEAAAIITSLFIIAGALSWASRQLKGKL
jgi:hypothetical protein